MTNYSFNMHADDLITGVDIAKRDKMKLNVVYESDCYELRFQRKLEDSARELLFSCDRFTNQADYERALVYIEESIAIFGKTNRGENQRNRLLKLISMGKECNLTIPRHFDKYLADALREDLKH